MMHLIRQHWFAACSAFSGIGKAPLNFICNVLVIAAALSLPFAGLTILENIRPLSQQVAVEPEISVFLTPDISRDKASALAPAIRQIMAGKQIKAKLEFIPKEKALNALQAKNGLANVVATLGSNPLPDAYVLKFNGFQEPSEAAKAVSLVADLKGLIGVDHVQIDSDWVKRLAGLVSLASAILLAVAGALVIVVIAVIFNTIRLQAMTRRAEIEITRVLGATDNYIMRPFYYSGVLLGIGAGAVALAVVHLLLGPLNVAVAEFASLYAAEFLLLPPSLPTTALLLALSGLLGIVGANLSVRRYL